MCCWLRRYRWLWLRVGGRPTAPGPAPGPALVLAPDTEAVGAGASPWWWWRGMLLACPAMAGRVGWCSRWQGSTASEYSLDVLGLTIGRGFEAGRRSR